MGAHAPALRSLVVPWLQNCPVEQSLSCWHRHAEKFWASRKQRPPRLHMLVHTSRHTSSVELTLTHWNPLLQAPLMQGEPGSPGFGPQAATHLPPVDVPRQVNPVRHGCLASQKSPALESCLRTHRLFVHWKSLGHALSVWHGRKHPSVGTHCVTPGARSWH